MKNFWILDTGLSGKKLLFWCGCLAALFLVGLVFYLTPAIIFAVGIFLLTTGIVVFLTITRGITIVQQSFFEQKTRHIVRDTFFPQNTEKSYRGLHVDKTNNTATTLYLLPQSNWSYLGLFKKIILRNHSKRRNALILGGGGAAMSLNLLESFRIRSETVESSSVMIAIAQKYFFPLRKKVLSRYEEPITFIHTDAFSFMKTVKKHYGLIVVDLFRGERVVPKISDLEFVKQLASHGEYVLVNFGITQLEKTAYQKFAAYSQVFSHSHIYIDNENYLGVFSQKHPLHVIKTGQRIL